MPIKTALPALPNVNLYRNVSINVLRLIPEHVRHDYAEGEALMGVYTRGDFDGNEDCAIAVTGMASCGALILVSDTAYLAVHIGGAADAINKFSKQIEEFQKTHKKYYVVGATGPDGSSDFALECFVDELSKLFKDTAIDIYKNQRRIAMRRNGEVGCPSDAITNPVKLTTGSTSCFEKRSCVIL